MGTKRGSIGSLETGSFTSGTGVSGSRGQITIFIIIGILILLIFGGAYFFISRTVTETLTAEGEPVIAAVPLEFQPLQRYTDACLTGLGKRGLRILGEQGGYIHPDVLGEFSSTDPADADGLDLEPLKVPYWHYSREPNAGNKVNYASLQPPLHDENVPELSIGADLSIEAQLARFVEEKIESCLQDYAPFTEQGFFVDVQSEPEMQVAVGPQAVNFWLKLEVEAVRGDARHEFRQFFVKIPLRLQDYYAAADNIRKLEQNYSILEKQALDLVQVYAGADADKLPPTSGATFDLVPTLFWSTADIKVKIQEMLTANVPLIRFAGTDNFYQYQYPASDLSGLYQRTYDNMVLPLTAGEGTEVRFDYLGWQPYLKVNAGGATIKPDHMATHYSILHFGVQNYNTLYDLSYPVLVSIHDPQALDGEGYTFVFALESNVRDNRPAQDNEEFAPPVASFQRSAICNPEQRSTELVRAIVVDSGTKEPLEAVQFAFQIPEQDTCEIGVTNDEGEVEASYPAVYGGVLNLVKQDYLTNLYPLDTYNYQNQPAVLGYAVADVGQPAIEMHKFKTLKATVKKKALNKCIRGAPAVHISEAEAALATGTLLAVSPFATAVPGGSIGSRDACFGQDVFGASGEPVQNYKPQYLDGRHQWYFSNVAVPLEENEEVTVILNRVRDIQPGIYQPEFTAFVSERSGQEPQDIELVPGVYEVSGFLRLNEEIIIPAETRHTGGVATALSCLDLDGCPIPLPETFMEQFMSGSLQWDTERTYMTITPEQLYNAESIEFYVPAMNIRDVPPAPHIRVVEDLQVMGQVGNISTFPEVRGALEPRFG